MSDLEKPVVDLACSFMHRPNRARIATLITRIAEGRHLIDELRGSHKDFVWQSGIELEDTAVMALSYARINKIDITAILSQYAENYLRRKFRAIPDIWSTTIPHTWYDMRAAHLFAEVEACKQEVESRHSASLCHATFGPESYEAYRAALNYEAILIRGWRAAEICYTLALDLARWRATDDRKAVSAAMTLFRRSARALAGDFDSSSFGTIRGDKLEDCGYRQLCELMS